MFYSVASVADTSDIKNNFFNSLENFFDGKFKDTDISIKSKEGNKPEIGIKTFKPLNDTESEITFFQGSLFAHDERETLNLGFGKRILSDDESFLYGLNAFYDHELDYDHQRGSIGAEIKSSILELNTNNYFAISNEKTGKNNVKEEVADGYDVEIGAHIPYMPTAKIYTKLFEYDIPGGADFEGLEYSSKIGIPNSGIDFEVGYKDFGNASYDDQWFFNLTFNFNKMNPNTSFISDEAFERVSMKEKKYEKVRRENLIVKSKSFTVKAGGF
jgi:adhesin/invasin